MSEPVPSNEQAVALAVFSEMLRAATADGGRKRAAGIKPPWWRDGSHMPAVWSHFRKRAQGELRDPDSGAHPYVHAAWRLLAVAYQETHGMVDPAGEMCAGCGRPGAGRCAPCRDERVA